MKVKNQLVVMLGFDCDRPRGDYINTEIGAMMANQKMNSIQKISKDLENLKIPRTFFIAGQFLESMSKKYGNKLMKNIFKINNDLVEIGDHTYSHNIIKSISSRPDKNPSSLSKIQEEYNTNTQLFQDILNLKIPFRGFRTPLGHFNGLQNNKELQKLFKELKVKYISSDLRDEKESLNPPLKKSDGTLRQPYYYENGLLEIPTMGWQDTVFSNTTKTPLYEKPPTSYNEIILYYQKLFNTAKNICIEENTPYFLGLTLHPYDNSIYNKNGNFFDDIYKIVRKCEGIFSTYEDVSNIFKTGIE